MDATATSGTVSSQLLQKSSINAARIYSEPPVLHPPTQHNAFAGAPFALCLYLTPHPANEVHNHSRFIFHLGHLQVSLLSFETSLNICRCTHGTSCSSPSSGSLQRLERVCTQRSMLDLLSKQLLIRTLCSLQFHLHQSVVFTLPGWLKPSVKYL